MNRDYVKAKFKNRKLIGQENYAPVEPVGPRQARAVRSPDACAR